MGNGQERQAVEYVVEVYAKENDSYLGTYPISGLTLQDLQEIFRVPADNPMYDCWPITEAHVDRLQVAIGRELDIENTDCFVVGVRPD